MHPHHQHHRLAAPHWVALQRGTCPGAKACLAGRCTSGCLIDGGVVDAGTFEPGAGCGSCNPTGPNGNPNGWTPATGTPPPGACSTGEVCDKGACQAGCFLDNAFVPDGGIDPTGCNACNSGVSTTRSTKLPDQTPCYDGGTYCSVGVCVPDCLIGGALVTAGTADATNVCQSCQPKVDAGSYSPVSDGTSCTSGGNYCQSGACILGCDVQNILYTPGEADAGDLCQVCAASTPGQPVTSLSPATDGTRCNNAGGDYCFSGSCALECLIGGVLLVPDGTVDGGNPNVCCNVSASPNAWTPGFGATSVSPGTGNSPEGIAIGDVSGDGKPDIVVTNYGDGTLSILQGQGGGSFAAQTTVSVGTLPQAVALADFNADTLLDIAVVNNGGSDVTVLLNQGDDGGFTAATYAVGSKPTDIAVGDFQKPGSGDLVVSDSVSGKVGVLLSNGNGTFQAQSTYPAGVTPAGVAVADFNNDGHPDIAVVNSGSSNAMVLVNSGNGSNFTNWATVSVGLLPQAIAAVDLNGNSQPALVIGDSTGTVSASSIPAPACPRPLSRSRSAACQPLLSPATSTGRASSTWPSPTTPDRRSAY